MTIFRSKLLLGLLLSGLPAAPAIGQAARTGWVGAGPDSEGFRKLLFVSKGENHGEIYFRCRPGDGWTFLIANAGATRAAVQGIVLASAAVTERPTYRVRPDNLDGGYYIDAAVPAESRLFDQMKGGSALVANGIRYPVATLAERRAVASFAADCLESQ